MASRQNRPAGWEKRGVAVLLAAVLLIFVFPAQPAYADASLNADLLSEPVFIAFASQSPEGDVRVFYTVWAPNTATGVWTGAGVTINLDTATYSYPAVCGDGTAVTDVYPNVTIYTMCSALNGYLPSPVDRLTVTWTTDADGDSVNTTFDRAFWWFLSPSDEPPPPPSGEHVEDWNTPWLGVGQEGIGIAVGAYDAIYIFSHPVNAEWLSGDTYKYYNLFPNGINMVLRVGGGQLCIFFPDASPIAPNGWNCFSTEELAEADDQAIVLYHIPGKEVSDNVAHNMLRYNLVRWNHPVWKPADLWTATTTELTPADTSFYLAKAWELAYSSYYGSWIRQLHSPGIKVYGLFFIPSYAFSDTPPWEVSTTTYDPGSWTGIGDVIGLPSASDTASATYTTSWENILCTAIGWVITALDVISLPWDLTKTLFEQLSGYLDAGRNFLLSGFSAIADFPEPINIVVGFTVTLLLLGIVFSLAKQITNIAKGVAEVFANAPKLALAMLIVLVVSAIAHALGADISQQITVCNFSAHVEASTSGTYFGGGEGGGGGSSGLR